MNSGSDVDVVKGLAKKYKFGVKKYKKEPTWGAIVNSKQLKLHGVYIQIIPSHQF